MLFPNDHARTLIELLKGFGPEGSDLVRRWVVALLIVPEHERGGVVAAVEARITSAYADGLNSTGRGVDSAAPSDPTVYLNSGVVQRDGHTEQFERAYAPAPRATADSASESTATPRRKGAKANGGGVSRQGGAA